MSNHRTKNISRISPETERLVSDALSLAASGSRVEDIFWENKLLERLMRLLHAQNQNAIDAALDQTIKINPIAYDVLAENAETLAESMTLTHADVAWDVVLIAIPIIARTRYNIPSGKLSPDSIQTTGLQLHEHIAAQQAKVALVPWLYSIDQMPHSHCQTRQLLEKLANAAIHGSEIKLELRDMPETIPVLADPRYIVGVVAAPSGAPLFRWQEEAPRRQERGVCLLNWQKNMQAVVAAFMPGCEFELTLPEAYFTNCRESDRKIRPLSILAAVSYLESLLDLQLPGCLASSPPLAKNNVTSIGLLLRKKGLRKLFTALYGHCTTANLWPMMPSTISRSMTALSAKSTTPSRRPASKTTTGTTNSSSPKFVTTVARQCLPIGQDKSCTLKCQKIPQPNSHYSTEH
jgi:hypothetical protein